MNSLDDRYPGRIFVALPYTGFGDSTPSLEPRMSEWPVPSIAATNETSLSALPYELPFHVDGVAKLPTLPLKDVADALIYYGPRRSLRRVPAPAEIYRDDRYFDELNRMYQVVSEGRALNRAELLRDKTNDPLPENPNR